jgi:hypothetical protein
MRAGANPDIVKPYSRCGGSALEPGTVTMENNDPTTTFHGEKWIELGEKAAFGGRNAFLEILYYVCGALWVACDVMIAATALLRTTQDS